MWIDWVKTVKLNSYNYISFEGESRQISLSLSLWNPRLLFFFLFSFLLMMAPSIDPSKIKTLMLFLKMSEIRNAISFFKHNQYDKSYNTKMFFFPPLIMSKWVCRCFHSDPVSPFIIDFISLNLLDQFWLFYCMTKNKKNCKQRD